MAEIETNDSIDDLFDDGNPADQLPPNWLNKSLGVIRCRRSLSSFSRWMRLAKSAAPTRKKIPLSFQKRISIRAFFLTKKEVTLRKPRLCTTKRPFAVIKAYFQMRRCLLRGLEGVQAEWQWCCTAFNLKKLIHLKAALRAEQAENTKLATTCGT